jgi:hypothetical protein
MKILAKLALAILLITGFACKTTCPPDEKIGSVDLGDTTMTFIPDFYIQEASLKFKNESGDMLELILQDRMQQMDKLCIETICTELEFDGKSTCKYFDASSHRFIYSSVNEDLLMDLLFSIEIAKTKTEYFYDIMTLSLSTADNNFAYGQYHTAIRFDDPTVVPPAGNNMMSFQENVQLADTTFANVYVNESDQIKTYYTRATGLAGFEWNDTVWRFAGWE